MALRINDFGCNTCLHVFESLWDTKTNEYPPCPNCGSSDLAKHIGAPRIVGGTGGLYSKVPDGFRDVAKQILKTVPDHAKGKEPTSL